MHPLVVLARQAVEACVHGTSAPAPPADLPDTFRKPAAAFVCLKLGGDLRGCIGTVSPRRRSVAEEVIENAAAACSRDPRFPAVRADELPDLHYTVDVLEAPEPVAQTDALDPRHYGVIVQKGHRRGLLLPDLAGVDTVADQIAIARRKAGIAPEETGVTLFRFRVVRYGEEG